MTADPGTRLDRRKARTRAALIAAARELLAERVANEVSIQDITEQADVGFGSFYNHFGTKQDLFDAAIAEVLEEHGAMLDSLTSDIADPAEVFATSVRITARFPRTHPNLARIIERTGPHYLTAPTGLAPRALRDLNNARTSGRFDFDDDVVAIACVGGALLGAIHFALGMQRPGAIDRAADALALNLLRMFGVPRDEARALVARKLPKPL